MNVDRPPVISRRFLLQMAGFGVAICPLQASNGEFWNKKPSADWNSEEIDRLITKSPWAKTVKAQYAAGGANSGNGSDYPGSPGSPGSGTGTSYPGGGTGRSGGGYPGGTGRSGGGIGIPGIGGLSIPGLGGGNRGRGNGSPRAGSASPYEGVVRWESARPVMEAMKSALPEDFQGRYVICVSGIPLLGSHTSTGEDDDRTARRQEADEMDRLKGLTSLQIKGHDFVQAGVAKRQVGAGYSFLFGFSKELLPVHEHDTEIQFRTQLGRLTLKASFLPREMLYHGELAV